MDSLDYVKYRFGAGRYIQEENALLSVGTEASRFGKKALILAGPTSWSIAGDRILKSLEEAGLLCVLSIYHGHCCDEAVEEHCHKISESSLDMVVGVGGGRIMDLAKTIASVSNTTVILIPTSSATCACFTPLSVMYTQDGKSAGVRYHDCEVNALIVDEAVMLSQPKRLLAAGILDAMAKYVEITNGRPSLSSELDDIDKYSAYHLAELTYSRLLTDGPSAYEAAGVGRLTKSFREVIFISLALTGLISNLMRGIGQTSIAHYFGNALHTLYTDTAERFLHGEQVATGMLMQLRYNKTPERIPELRDFMLFMGMPVSLKDYGLDDKAVEEIAGFIAEDSRFVPQTREGLERILDAIEEIS